MGLLSEGRPLTWEQTKQHCEYVREHGVRQFIEIYQSLKDRQNDCLKWGDEVRYLFKSWSDEHKKVANDHVTF